MTQTTTTRSLRLEALLLGCSIAIGLVMLGYLLGKSRIDAQNFQRSVVVKGLAEREVPADIAIWPLRFTVAGNSLAELSSELERQTDMVVEFMRTAGFSDAEITSGPPSVMDSQAQSYRSDAAFRYTGSRTVNVYTPDIDKVRKAQNELTALGKAGVVIVTGDYQTSVQYLFNGLNDIKPAMVEQATREARVVAQKFADDSGSALGRIKSARQGQFSVSDRDSNTPYIKNIRIVSTVEYFLAD